MKKQQGFTLIELMIVVAVIGVLSAIAIPAYQKYVAKAEVASALATLTGIKTNVEARTVETGQFPDAGDETGLGVPTTIQLGSVAFDQGTASDGSIKFTFGSSASDSVSTLVSEKAFELTRDANGIWDCKASTTDGVPTELLPKSCQ
ncbi:pilin [Photobacterium angustum]|uniref:Fimbrial protein n=1 Tax=Photobacterium angustum (strain S14 / CCUG 15956) TaxID=314292 RepID=Q1ZNK0_PHOAS|nr:pilin [Photobacterium angustum]EAS63729.1 fimbrial protein [Vibrio angustum S14] [Photobacterium angustum S14]